MFSLLYGPTLTSVPEYWKQNIALSIRTFVGKVISLLFNILSRFIIAFLQRNKHLLISWLQSPSTVIWEPEKIVCHCFHFFPPSICHEIMGLDAMILVFRILSFKPVFSLSSLVPVHFLPLEWCHLHIWGYWYFSQQSWFLLVLHPGWHFTCIF